MTRYTFKSLVAECALLNEQMKDAGIDWVLVTAQRYEWSAIDLRNSQNQGGSVHSNLECGSPRQCASAARLFAYQKLAQAKMKEER